jgi:ketosteroid isomerase-like protein
MSDRNVEVIRAAVAAFNRGDWEAALADLAPDFEFDFTRAVGPVHGVFKLDQIRGFLDEFFGQWESVRFEIDELIPVGEEVVVRFDNTHRGRDGIEVRVRPSGVWTFRNGTIIRACLFQELDEAKKAAGLPDR